MTAPQSSKPRIWDRWWVIAGMALVLWVGMRLALNGVGSWPGALLGGVVSCALVTWQVVRRRRREADAIGTDSDAVPALERRILKEELPEDPAERAAMTRMITRRLDRTRRNRKWALPMMAFFCFVPPVLLLVQGARVPGVLYGVFGVVFFGWLVWASRRMVSRMERMEQRIGAADRGEPAIRG